VPIDSLEISGNLDLDDASSTSLAASQVPIVSDSTVLVPIDHESSDSMILSFVPFDPIASDLQNSASQETSFHSSMPTHPMVTRSKGGIVCPKQFPDYRTYYSTKHPLCALHCKNLLDQKGCKPKCRFSQVIILGKYEVGPQGMVDTK
jgi:hypothetical protein